jgi:hypothetical protein
MRFPINWFGLIATLHALVSPGGLVLAFTPLCGLVGGMLTQLRRVLP